MTVHGCLDIWLSELVSGWAYDDASGSPVWLDVEVNGEIVSDVLGVEFRSDLAEHGFAGGWCAFHFDPRKYLRWGRNSCRLLIHGTQEEIPFYYSRELLLPENPPSPVAPVVLDPLAMWQGRHDPGFFRPPLSGVEKHDFALYPAGPYNSRTNFLQALLELNGMPSAKENAATMLFKHFPAPVLKRVSDHYNLAADEQRIFLVMVRDPRTWVASMKRRLFEAEFASIHDPFVIRIENALSNGWICRDILGPVYPDGDYSGLFAAGNIIAYWNEYYRSWCERGFGSSTEVYFLRCEDIAMHPAETIALLRGLVHMAPPAAVSMQITSVGPGPAIPGALWSVRAKLASSQMDLDTEELRFLEAKIDVDLCHYFGYRVSREPSPAES